MLAGIMIFGVAIAVPLVILLGNHYGTKRGCGRGCATCGNREICHGKRKKDAEEESAAEK